MAITQACRSRSLIVALLALGLALPCAQAASPKPGNPAPAWNGLALIPPMGYNNWSYYECSVTEDIILAQAHALVTTGLAARGYNTITTDDCWMQKTRGADGTLLSDTQKFPHGMAWLGEQIHALGLRFGIYEDAGVKTCGGFAGSWNFFQKDADTFAKWKVDYIKLDGCNVPQVPGETKEQTYRNAYKAFSDAILKSHRKMVFSESAPAYFIETPDLWHTVLGWASQYGSLWRQGDDIANRPVPGRGKWRSINRNYSENVGLAQYAGPGHWNDPDFLIVGDDGLTEEEMQTQMSLWAIMAAPLIISTDLTKIGPAALAILSNPDILAIDQDPAGVQGHIVQQDSGFTGEKIVDENRAFDILARPLANGDVAVVFYNKGEVERKLATIASIVGLKTGSSMTLKNLVSKTTTTSQDRIEATVPPHGSVIYRISAH